MKDLSHLPRANTQDDGAPDDNDTWARLLLDALEDEREPPGSFPTAMGTRLRFSDAGKCARYLGYTAEGLTPTDPMDVSGLLAVDIGTYLHDKFQDYARRLYGDRVEAEVQAKIDGLDCSGHADLLADADPDRVLVEVKSVGGFGYKLAIGNRGKRRMGPKRTHVVQTAFNVVANDADAGVIVYLSKEALSKNAAEKSGADEVRRVAAQWTYDRATLEAIAQAEIDRQHEILRLIDEDGVLPPRHVPDEMPSGARIVDTSSSRWELREDEGEGEVVLDSGELWNGSFCDYCSMRSGCDAVDDPETPTVEHAREVWPADFLPCEFCGEGANPNLPGDHLTCHNCYLRRRRDG